MRTLFAVITAAGVLALLACAKSPEGERSAGAGSGQPDSSRNASSPVRDSTWVEVQGPTMVAFFPPMSPAAVDSGGDVADVLDDFGYHLSSADSSLRALGFRVQVMPGRAFHLVRGGHVTLFSVPRDSADVGYYFIAPNRTPVVYYGVQTGAGLVEYGRLFLRAMPAP